jgi:two-component system, chemotaxis family, protein-glutamate methylesterase/glutaminase
MTRAVRVLIIEGSAVTRRILTAILAADREIEVVAAVPGLPEAREAMADLRPDVVTLDVAVLSRRGLASLERMIHGSLTPVVLVSPPTRKAREMTMLALELGAVDVVRMPSRELVRRMPDVVSQMLDTVKAAARARLGPVTVSARAEPHPSSAGRAGSARRVIAVGASTGGTEAIRQFLMAMPPDAPGLVIVQHMPERFTRAFAERCDGLCPVRVQEAKDGDRLGPGHAFIAPGNLHMRVHRDGQSYRVAVESGPPVNGHRPSIDVLFNSTAAAAGENAVGVILTGMGADGARGLSAMKRAGARTLAQDEASCVVFGMPREAIALGAVDHVLPLSEIGRAALELCGPFNGSLR